MRVRQAREIRPSKVWSLNHGDKPVDKESECHKSPQKTKCKPTRQIRTSGRAGAFESWQRSGKNWKWFPLARNPVTFPKSESPPPVTPREARGVRGHPPEASSALRSLPPSAGRLRPAPRPRALDPRARATAELPGPEAWKSARGG